MRILVVSRELTGEEVVFSCVLVNALTSGCFESFCMVTVEVEVDFTWEDACAEDWSGAHKISGFCARAGTSLAKQTVAQNLLVAANSC